MLITVEAIFVFLITINHQVDGQKIFKEKKIISNRNNVPQSLLVKIEDGYIRGREDKTVELNKTYFAFQGIPFAQPPVGDLRFKAPIPISKWNNILDATKDKSVCIQGGAPLLPIDGSEDCLYINVYTPSLKQNNLSVMVWLHGGAFLIGDSQYKTNGPDYLLDQDVVFVSFNYRLGVLGFLSTNDLTLPGNNGLRDQILALKWVQKNIAQFGGDPNNVTAFGNSAGAVSISYLLQRNLSKGLFQRAILESGTSLISWALSRKAKEIALEIGNLLNVDGGSSQSLVDGLKQVEVHKLQNESNIVLIKDFMANPFGGLAFTPVIEPEHEGAIITEKSHQLLVNGNFDRIPTIMGFNSNEAAFVINSNSINFLKGLYLQKFAINPTALVPVDMNIENFITKAIVGRDIYNHYFNPIILVPVAFQLESLSKFISDNEFVRPIRETVLQKSKYAPVYYYKFSFEGQLGKVKKRKVSGVGHTEELGYLFRGNISSVSQNDQLIRFRLVKLWTNFAKFSNPTPVQDPLLENITWPIASSDIKNLNYINIDTNLKIQVNPNSENMEYWKQLYDDYGHPPYDTY